MLKTLYIKNFALIDELTIEFGSGSGGRRTCKNICTEKNRATLFGMEKMLTHYRELLYIALETYSLKLIH
ncbi:MAG: hypothetical protein HY22_04965 [[Candidatus Thermochlorobacteriaceae] bacterium GBChlB]|nr:MAG: hypothetical protein HY22_04965 [[Candidatus Thermochlorobacteriaceae] bacterium GBChlB]